jgi:hypothetical protein
MNLVERIKSELRVLLVAGDLTPETLTKVVRILDSEITLVNEAIVSQLKEMVSEWEASMGTDDGTLYSLGVRRAIDVISGQSAFEQLPVLEKPDTPLD